MFEPVVQLVFTQSRGWRLSLPAVCGIQQDLSVLIPSLCAVVAPEFQYEGLGGLFLELHLHTKQSFDFFFF